MNRLSQKPRKPVIQPYAGYEATKQKLPLTAGLELLRRILDVVSTETKAGTFGLSLFIDIEKNGQLSRIVFSPDEAIAFATAACDEFAELAQTIQRLQQALEPPSEG